MAVADATSETTQTQSLAPIFHVGANNRHKIFILGGQDYTVKTEVKSHCLESVRRYPFVLLLPLMTDPNPNCFGQHIL